MKLDIDNALNHILGDHSCCAKYVCKGAATPGETNYLREAK